MAVRCATLWANLLTVAVALAVAAPATRNVFSMPHVRMENVADPRLVKQTATTRLSTAADGGPIVDLPWNGRVQGSTVTVEALDIEQVGCAFS